MTELEKSVDEKLKSMVVGEFIAEDVVELFYERLVSFANKKLAALPPQVADDEGAVVSALRSFFSGVAHGQFPELRDQNDLWAILATITARKAVRQLRHHWKKSGEAGHVIRRDEILEILAVEPAIEKEVMIAEAFEQMIDSLDDAILKQIVSLRLEGHETAEIADKLGIHVRSVQRKIMMIKTKWLEDSEKDHS